jgi:predicted nucleic acid-binding protein
MKAFFDTNVLVYTVTLDPRKRQADRILRTGGIVSVQVLNEFANVARNKLLNARKTRSVRLGFCRPDRCWSSSDCLSKPYAP